MARATTPKLSIASRDYLAHRFRRGRAHQQYRGYKSLLTRLQANIGDLQIGSITPDHLEDFFYGTPDAPGLRETCSPATLGRYRADLAAFFDWCHRKRWMKYTGMQILDGISEKSTRSNRDRTRLDPVQITALVAGAETVRDRCLITFVANTGVRISEALGMRIGDVNLDRGELYVTLFKQKSKVVTRYITSDLDVELRAWLTAYTEDCGALSAEWFLFPARHKGQFGPGGKLETLELRYNPTAKITNPGRILATAAKSAGIVFEKGDGWHTVRRSVARIFFDNADAAGHDSALRITQAFLDHANAETTEIYIGLDLEHRKVQLMMQGKPFLSGLTTAPNIVDIRDAR